MGRPLGEDVLMSAVMQPVGGASGADWNSDGLCAGLVLPSLTIKLFQVLQLFHQLLLAELDSSDEVTSSWGGNFSCSSVLAGNPPLLLWICWADPIHRWQHFQDVCSSYKQDDTLISAVIR